MASQHAPLHDAIVHTACNRWQNACASWQQGAHLVPRLSALFLADIAFRIGDIELAQSHVSTCEVFAPGLPYIARLRERIATIVPRRARWDEPAAPETLPVEMLQRLARYAMECHHWPQAIALWTLAAERSGPDVETAKRLAICYTTVGDHTAALTHFRDAAKLASDPTLTDSIDRTYRLDQRRFDGFAKHLQRIHQHPALDAARLLAPSSSDIAADMRIFEQSARSVFASARPAGPGAGAESTLLEKVETARTATEPTWHEVDLPALRARLASHPAAGYASPPLLGTVAERQ